MVVPRKATTSPERALVMAAAVLADHGGDELDEEQGEGHEDGDAGHEAEVDPEGVGAGSGVEGHDRSPGDLAPQPGGGTVGGAGEVFGDGVEDVAGYRGGGAGEGGRGRVGGEADAGERVAEGGHPAGGDERGGYGHQATSVQLATATAP